MSSADERASSIRPVFDIFLIVGCRERRGVPLHQHPDYEFIYVLEGRYGFTLNALEGELGPRQGLLAKPGDTHSDSFLDIPCRYLAVNFRLPSEQGLNLFAPHSTETDQVFRRFPAEVSRLLRELDTEWELADEVSSPLRESLLQAFFWRLLRTFPQGSLHPDLWVTPEVTHFRTALEELFQLHIHEDLGVEFMARHLHMSRRGLTRLCKKHLGRSPARAFLQFKVERARDLLLQTTMSIKEISAYLGFPNPYHFSAAFKRVTTRSPRVFRETGLNSS
ncbi:MAG: helix-turn-helix domain-containing protein [Planctomycetota bacterium]|jgi:AraC-like DNA-binding protein